MLALLVLVIFAMLIATPCIKLKTGPNQDDLERIGAIDTGIKRPAKFIVGTRT